MNRNLWVVYHRNVLLVRLRNKAEGFEVANFNGGGAKRPPPNENSYTSQMVRTIKYFAEL